MPLRSLLVLATIAVLASCFSEDKIIPEISHAEVLTMLEQPTNSDMATISTDFNHRAKALDTIALIKAKGGGTKECQAAAKDLHASVDAYVALSNHELHALSTGSECPEDGLTDVTKCTTKQEAAQEDATAAEHAVKDALRAPQQLALEDLMNCMSSGLCPQIETARATLESAKKTEVEKDAAVVAIKDECSDFETSAARQMAECQCAAKKAHDKAWEAVTSGAAEREKSWKTAEQLLCALNKDATCKGSPTPTVNAVVLAKGVAGAVCPAKEGGQGPTSNPTTAKPAACSGSSKALAESECRAWQAFFDATGGGGHSRDDPCYDPYKIMGCQGKHITKIDSWKFATKLSGTIPEAISALTALSIFHVNTQKISGSIPRSISELTALTSLNFGPTRISGTIPESICALPISKMSYFQLSWGNSNTYWCPLPSCAGILKSRGGVTSCAHASP